MMLVLIFTGCIKETYNMKKLSDKIKYSPTFSVSAATGVVSFSDLVKSSDTVIFDNDKFIRVIFRKDSVINLKLRDYYDLNNMVSFRKGYKVGELKLDDFQGTMPVTLNTISLAFTNPALRTTFLALNGTTSIFPGFPQTNIGEKTFPAFPNFQNALFSSGTIVISVKNNLAAPLGDIKISLFNSVGHTAIGSQLTIPAIAAGGTQSVSLDLAGKTVTNTIIAAIIFTGSTATSSPVFIDLNSSVQVGLSATNLKVQSGRIILPTQTITSLSGSDMVSFNPGANVEIEKMKVLTGNIGYTLVSNSSISGSFSFTLPTTPVISKTITISGATNVTSSVSLNNTIVNLGTDPAQRFNRIPVNYSISVNSNGSLINFNKNDSIHISINMLNPNLDYVKGYFGQLSEQVDPKILDTGLDEVLNQITGEFHISNPSIKLNYRNSFGIPLEVTFNVAGKKKTQTVNLGLAPFTILSPSDTILREVSSSYTINKANSSLPNLISLPPAEITFSGSAKMNPTIPPTGVRNNYIFGTSRFVGDIEVEVPLELWIKNLQFSDTLDNFLKPDDKNSNSFNAEDFDLLQINIVATNGFPLGASLKFILYDSVKNAVVKTIDATNIILPAPIDINGKSSGKTESTTTIEFKKDFFDAIKSANKIILTFTLITSENGTKDVKIYSDYSISFKASLVVKPNINL
jgi:hypothetical protein